MPLWCDQDVDPCILSLNLCGHFCCLVDLLLWCLAC
jgi:hypothetical protein